MDVEVINIISDEEYVVQRAKNALKSDPLSAKAWMITAKSLYPNNFKVQFEAYCIEKGSGHVKEAAKCFSDLLNKFQQEPEFWKEVENVTAALRCENDVIDAEKQFLCDMFKHISLDVQHQLLLFTADHCEDTMEHCRLLLLLLQKFPSAVSNHGPRLVDTLLSAEKHSHSSNQPVNSFRKLLVCDLLPLLGNENVVVEFSSKLLFKLLHKAIEFYLCYLGMPLLEQNSVTQPWAKLFGVLELTGRHLGWESYLTSFNNWSKESYWQKILTFCQTHKPLTVEDHINTKQLLYCLTVFLLHCLHEYTLSLTPEASPGQPQASLLLVEAFVDKNLPNPSQEPKAKRRKGESDSSVPYLTVDKPEHKNVTINFIMAVNCWDLLHSAEHIQREFNKLNGYLKLDPLLTNFLIDYAIYKGHYDEALNRLQQTSESYFSKNLVLTSLFYLTKNYMVCFDHIVPLIQSLPTTNMGTTSTNLIVGGNQRHLHFLPITHHAVLQYCTKLLLRSIKEFNSKHPNNYNELAIGNMLVLMQLDWPQEEDMLPALIELIQLRGSFGYLLFQSYIVNVDILEELTYLWSEQGGQITLDIVPHIGQRRIGTRGADKGVKEEIKQAIKRQISRSNDPLDQLIISFITQERGHISQTLR